MNSRARFVASLAIAFLWAIWGIDIVKLLPSGEWWWMDLKLTLYVGPFVALWWWGCK